MPDREDEEGNLAGFVVADDSNGDSVSGSEGDMYSDEDSDEEVRRPTATTNRHKLEGAQALMELPHAGKKKAQSADDHQKKRTEMALRRKKQAEKQAEKTKKETIDRILNMKGAKGKREEKAAKAKKTKVEEVKKVGLSCAHFRLVSSPLHPAGVMAFSSGVPLPPLFR